MNGFFFLILGIALSMAVIPLAMRAAPYLGMVDEPDPRKVHATPVPRIGGLGITIGALIPLAVLLPWDPLLGAFIVGSTILLLFGAWDDAHELSHWIKFVGQFAAVGLVVYYGDLWVERFPFASGFLLPAEIGKPFTVFAMVGVINAINHSDGLDGLAGGESLLGLIVMGFLSYVVDDQFGVFLCCAVAGGILGFLRFNTHPARIFMGDAGSQFIGFAMGFLAVYLTQVSHPALSPALPLLLIGLPIADINAVFYLRISNGMNWFKATRNHVHHRLLDLGFAHYETVIVIYSVQALLVGSAVLLRYQSDFLVVSFFMGVISALFLALTYAERAGLNFEEGTERRALSRLIGSFGADSLTATYVERIAVWMFSIYLVLGASSVTSEESTVVWVAGVLFLVCLTALVRGIDLRESLAARFSTVSLAVLTVYLGVQTAQADGWLSFFISTPAYLALGVVLALAIRFASEKVFKTTATDYLILFGLVMVAIFGRELLEVRQLSLLVIHSVVMIYASEFACRASSQKFPVVYVSVLVGFGTLFFRGLF